MRHGMKLGARLLLAGLLASVAAAAPAAIVLDFETIAPYPNGSDVVIGGFYNGGTASNGASGPNYGVQFVGSATLLCLNTLDDDFCSNASRGAPGPSDKGAMYWTSGMPAINLAAGFDTSFSFSYSAVVDGLGLAIYSGLNGSGTLLASAALPTTPGLACDGDFSGGASFCPFVTTGLTFSGLARSVVFTSGANEAVFDDLTFGSAVPSSTPEPASWAMMLGGFGAIGFALRRRHRGEAVRA